MRFLSDTMIDITDDIIKWASDGIPELEGRVYRVYPQKNLTLKTYMTVTPNLHNPTLIEDGEEVIADLGWQVQIVSKSPKSVDDVMKRVVSLYTAHNILLQGMSPGYNPDYHAYTVLLSFTTTLDRRGTAYI